MLSLMTIAATILGHEIAQMHIAKTAQQKATTDQCTSGRDNLYKIDFPLNNEQLCHPTNISNVIM